MALKVGNKVKQGLVWFKSGYIYSFRYTNFQFDPEPIVIIINYVKGVHPTTRHKHNYIQAINFNYIPRPKRKLFVENWTKVLKRYKGNVTLSWMDIVNKYPFLQLAIRRYFLDKGYIVGVSEIPQEKMNDVVIKSLSADYSKKALLAAVRKNTGVARTLKEPELIKKVFGGEV